MQLKGEVSEKALRIYKALIVMPSASATDLAQSTGFTRSDIYIQLSVLIAAGLAERIVINKKTLFRPCSPDVLVKHLDEQRTKVETLKVLYESQTSLQSHARVQVFEGQMHMEQVYRDLFDAHSIQAWFGVGDSAHLNTAVAYNLADTVRERKITFRDIIPNDARSLAYARRMQRIMGPTYSYRVAPTVEIENDTLVYKNKVAIIRRNEHNLFATVIEDASLATTFRSIFTISWRSLSPKKERIK